LAAQAAEAVTFSITEAVRTIGSGYGKDKSDAPETLLGVKFDDSFDLQSFSLNAVHQTFSFLLGTVKLTEPSNGGINEDEMDDLGVLLDEVTGKSTARLFALGGKATDPRAGFTKGELDAIRSQWKDRAELLGPDGEPKSADAAEIIKRLGPDASRMEPLVEVNLGARTAWIPGGEAALLDPERQ
jgi:hypothetical protein